MMKRTVRDVETLASHPEKLPHGRNAAIIDSKAARSTSLMARTIHLDWRGVFALEISPAEVTDITARDQTVIMSSKNIEQAQANAALADLVGAHNLITEIARHSDGFINGRARVAAEKLDASFRIFRQHCSKPVAERLRKKMEAERLPASG